MAWARRSGASSTLCLGVTRNKKYVSSWSGVKSKVREYYYKSKVKRDVNRSFMKVISSKSSRWGITPVRECGRIEFGGSHLGIMSRCLFRWRTKILPMFRRRRGFSHDLQCPRNRPADSLPGTNQRDFVQCLRLTHRK